MNIRRRLSLQFTLIVASIFLLFSVTLYQVFSNYRENNFYNRLKEKGLSSANLLLDENEIDYSMLRKIHAYSVNKPYNLSIYRVGDLKLLYTNKDTLKKEELNLYVHNLNNKKEIFFKKGGNEAVFFPYNHKAENIFIFVSAFDKYGVDKLIILKVIIWISLIISLFLIIRLSLFFSGQALKPISNIIKQVEKINDTNPAARLSIGNGYDELAKLSISFNDLLDRIHASLRMQHNFISNASHELRTPLTVIRGQIEVALMRKRNAVDYKEILHSTYEDVQLLNQLSESLLDLSGTEDSLSNINIVKINVYDVLTQAKEEITRRNENYKVNAIFDTNSNVQKIKLMGSNQLLVSAFINIMDNSCKYSDDHSVSIFTKIENNTVKIEFKDNGIGISRENLQLVFQPFFRSDNAKHYKGHGLGLALVKRIITLHNGSIEIKSELNLGTLVSVCLPVIIEGEKK